MHLMEGYAWGGGRTLCWKLFPEDQVLGTLYKSVGRIQDENITPNTDAETSALRDQLRKDAYFYKERLIVHLRADNGTLYPEYNQSSSSPGACSEDMLADRSGYTPINFII